MTVQTMLQSDSEIITWNRDTCMYGAMKIGKEAFCALKKS